MLEASSATVASQQAALSVMTQRIRTLEDHIALDQKDGDQRVANLNEMVGGLKSLCINSFFQMEGFVLLKL